MIAPRPPRRRHPDAGPPAPPPPRKPLLHPGAASIAAIAALSALAGHVGGGGDTAPPPPPPPAVTAAAAPTADPPLPLVAAGKPVRWWFAYKFAAATYPGDPDDPGRTCAFGGTPRRDGSNFSQRYVYASSADPTLRDGPGLIGTGPGDPLGATFGKIWNGQYYYVVWNDQFYGDPERAGADCDAQQCGSPWGHAKGVLAWNQAGQGVILQVTTPSWPGGGSATLPRRDGNTLGCVADDNNTSNAQDFFALQLSRDDVKAVLRALATASVSTDVDDPQIVARRLPGATPPADIDAIVATLGRQAGGKAFVDQPLSSGVRLIAKPSALHVPPWQFVSSRLGGASLLTATWWANPRIGPTRSAADVHCWDALLPTPPGRVDIAVKASWEGAALAFTGGPNHAKIGVATTGAPYAIFGDLNQQGALGDAGDPNGAGCERSQNGRGGLFFVLSDPVLRAGVAKLITGQVAAYTP